MPFENVTIKAKWTITNPKTGDISYALAALIIIAVSIIIYEIA